jgi:hypothetical protein
MSGVTEHEGVVTGKSQVIIIKYCWDCKFKYCSIASGGANMNVVEILSAKKEF